MPAKSKSEAASSGPVPGLIDGTLIGSRCWERSVRVLPFDRAVMRSPASRKTTPVSVHGSRVPHAPREECTFRRSRPVREGIAVLWRLSRPHRPETSQHKLSKVCKARHFRLLSRRDRCTGGNTPSPPTLRLTHIKYRHLGATISTVFKYCMRNPRLVKLDRGECLA